ncbi:MAG: VWA domain-containing protein [Saprospiraceae bacterium]
MNEQLPIPIMEKWRLILGGDQADGTGVKLSGEWQQIDAALAALYEYEQLGKFDYQDANHKQGGSGRSNPGIARWLGDIRKYFPISVVEVMQNDAMKHPELQRQMIFEPEILEKAEPDVNLVATLMQLGKLIPSKTKDTARRVIQTVVEALMQKLEQKTINALRGALDKSARRHNPRHNDINWSATIRRNLKHYQPKYKTIIPETLIGYGHKSQQSLKDIILCIDQSGSMGASIVYSGIFGAVMASLPNVRTNMILFDTEVADLTLELNDPVDILFGVQMGGGTDINKALGYCQGLIRQPEETVFVLITDLYEGGNQEQMLKRTKEMVDSGVQMICLLALNDQGSPSYDRHLAKQLAEMQIPVFACTPDQFPDLMAAAIQKRDLWKWVGEEGIVLGS